MATYTIELTGAYTIHADSTKEVLEFVEDWGVIPQLTSEHLPNRMDSVAIVVKDFETQEVLIEDKLIIDDE
jgi:hypothetical protein